ncbi:MAG: DNA polymerase IV, partial [Rhodospirillaceae bacterium]|nr:DNA polymerase IV [Rhodospirillaceae bacterium]
MAKLAAERDKPRGFAVIGRAEARRILAELPVRALWGIGEATARRMAEQGVTAVSQLQSMPEAELSTRWGKFGRQLAGLVQGVDHRPVTPDRPAKSVSTETTFARDIRDAGALDQALEPLAEGVGRRLAREDSAGRTVVLKLKTADFQVITRHHRLSDPTRRSDIILQAGRILLHRLADGRAFRLIGIGVTDLCPAAEADPPDLFGR